MAKIRYQNIYWNKWLTFLLSPFVISLFLAIILILTLCPATTKYNLTVSDNQKFKPFFTLYDDLNEDGVSDLITLQSDTNNLIAILVWEYPSGKVNQWNFDGRLLPLSNEYLFAGDFDSNHKKEIYLFSLRHDSLLLHCIDDIKNNKPRFSNVFISKIGFRKGIYQASIVKAEMDDLNGDGYKELIFGVNSGFSLTPRNIFAYDIHNKSCTSSSFLGMGIFNILQKDITGDGKNEILIQGYGPDNLSDTTIKYHDRSAWLMVLDQKLDFLFEPIEFKGAYSTILPFVFDDNIAPNQAGFYAQSTSDPEQTKLCLFSKEGKIIKEKTLSDIHADGIHIVFTIKEKGKNWLIIQKNTDNEILVVDENLTTISKRYLSAPGNHCMLDLDNDEQQEQVSVNTQNGKLEVSRYNLQHPATIDIPYSTGYPPLFSLKKNGTKKPELVIWDRESVIFIKYQVNSMFYLKWLLYLGIYLSILLFTLLIRWIQKNQFERNRRMEKRMTELQMKIVKNQLDPHFTLNAVNSIIYAVDNNEPERATEHLYLFSDLYRHLLLTADQYQCSLKDELNFTENYLKMEQLRFHSKYSYSIAIDKDVNPDTLIPKMCIQTAVENALKHGIFHLKANGEVTIKCSVNKHLIIDIRDNGIGRKASKDLQNSSTRKGIQLTSQYFDLYTKITNQRISSEIIDLMDDTGIATGTLVRITAQIK